LTLQFYEPLLVYFGGPKPEYSLQCGNSILVIGINVSLTL
jgi:hypothetical protein